MDELRAAADRARITAARDRARAQVVELTGTFDAIVEAARDSASDDEHDPDGATIGFERAQVAALVDMAAARVAELDAALDRVEQGTYGICATCGRAIAPARLDAMPVATSCISCAPASRPAPR